LGCHGCNALATHAQGMDELRAQGPFPTLAESLV
jgi:hypothetical protein